MFECSGLLIPPDFNIKSAVEKAKPGDRYARVIGELGTCSTLRIILHMLCR